MRVAAKVPSVAVIRTGPPPPSAAVKMELPADCRDTDRPAYGFWTAGGVPSIRMRPGIVMPAVAVTLKFSTSAKTSTGICTLFIDDNIEAGSIVAGGAPGAAEGGVGSV